MLTTSPKVDQYISESAEFARPILVHLREVVHAACPDMVEEIKWSFPFFTYKGEILCAMRAFKAHCGFAFWKGELVVPDAQAKGLGQFGKLTSVKDLPSTRVLTAYVKTAMRLNDEGVPPPFVEARRAKVKSKTVKPVLVPPELIAALEKNRAALENFHAFPPSHQREYAEWVSEAKRDETKARRVAKAVTTIAEGKSLNWKYEK